MQQKYVEYDSVEIQYKWGVANKFNICEKIFYRSAGTTYSMGST